MPQPQSLPGRGTLLNVATVVAGSFVGLAAGKTLPQEWSKLVVVGIGLFTMLLGLKMFLQVKNELVVLAGLVIGGLIGQALRIDAGLAQFAESVRQMVGQGGSFTEAIVTTSVLFCVGPMTLLGCIQDGLERKIELLAVKSLLDGVSSVFLAAALGWGVLVSAAVVLVVQGLLTLAARPMRPLANDADVMGAATATGGLMMLAIGLNLVGAVKIPAENFLPSLVVGPFVAWCLPKLFPPKQAADSP